MIKFDNNRLDELKLFLRTIPAHDAEFDSIKYDKLGKKVIINIHNPIPNDPLCIGKSNMMIEFNKVSLFLSLDTDKWGSDDTILILTLEDDYELIKKIVSDDIISDKHLYFIFQMFSGNEIHILCKEALFDIS